MFNCDLKKEASKAIETGHKAVVPYNTAQKQKWNVINLFLGTTMDYKKVMPVREDNICIMTVTGDKNNQSGVLHR